MRHTYADTSLARRDLGLRSAREPRGRASSSNIAGSLNEYARAFSLFALLSPCSCSHSVLPAAASNPPVRLGHGEADQILLDRGNAALKERKWMTARERISRSCSSHYPQSPLRAEAKLGVGDTYLGENNSAAYVYAQNEYREFLAFYPTNPRADYAQMQLGHGALQPDAESAARSDRDERSHPRIPDVSWTRYPASPLMPQVKQRLREAKDRLSDWDLQVGNFYLSIRLYPSAIDRYRHILKNDPEYTRRDALYFNLAESLEKSDKEG